MSSPKTRNILLVMFIVLTLILGSLSAYEFFKVQQVRNSSITTSTSTVISTLTTTSTTVTTETLFTTSTISVTSSVPTVPDTGNIFFSVKEEDLYFQYKRVDLPVGTSVTFLNVTFSNVLPAPTSTACVGYNIRVTFADGASEMLGIGACPIDFSPSIVLTEHSNPTAGIIFKYSFGDSFIAPGFYLLVTT